MKVSGEELREWLKAMQEYGVTELHYEDKESHLTLKREPAAVVQVSDGQVQPLAAAAGSVVSLPSGAASADGEEVPEEKIVKSPVVGVFYQSNVQDGPALVKVGDEVHEGDVVGIIEAMKLMNEVIAKQDGKIKEILVSSGQKVEYGQPLMILE